MAGPMAGGLRCPCLCMLAAPSALGTRLLHHHQMEARARVCAAASPRQHPGCKQAALAEVTTSY